MNEKYVGTLEELKNSDMCAYCGKPKHDGDCVLEIIKEGPDAGFVKNPFKGDMRTGECEGCGRHADLVWNFQWHCDDCRYVLK